MFTIPPLGRVKQENNHMFKASLDYLDSSGTAWATKYNPISKEQIDQRDTS